MSRNGTDEAITSERTNDQVFLHVSREVLDDLMARAGNPTPRDAANFRSGYLGLSPKCNSGAATELDIEVDDAVRFSRE